MLQKRFKYNIMLSIIKCFVKFGNTKKALKRNSLLVQASIIFLCNVSVVCVGLHFFCAKRMIERKYFNFSITRKGAQK